MVGVSDASFFWSFLLLALPGRSGRLRKCDPALTGPPWGSIFNAVVHRRSTRDCSIAVSTRSCGVPDGQIPYKSESQLGVALSGVLSHQCFDSPLGAFLEGCVPRRPAGNALFQWVPFACSVCLLSSVPSNTLQANGTDPVYRVKNLENLIGACFSLFTNVDRVEVHSEFWVIVFIDGLPRPVGVAHHVSDDAFRDADIRGFVFPSQEIKLDLLNGGKGRFGVDEETVCQAKRPTMVEFCPHLLSMSSMNCSDSSIRSSL